MRQLPMRQLHVAYLAAMAGLSPLAMTSAHAQPAIAQAVAPAAADAPKKVDNATPPAATATEALPQTDPVVARVDGAEIHMSDLTSAVAGLPAQYRQMPPATLFPMLLEQLVDQQAILDKARAEGLDKDPVVQKQIARAQNQALENALISRTVGPKVTDATVKARYDADIADKTGEQEIHARHILVPTEAEAKQIIADLNKGGDFAALAKSHSKDPGAANGGDLGFFKKGDMLPEFSAAAFALKPNEISQTPVHTTYGWHVIQVLEARAAPAPAFDQEKDQLRQQMIQENVQKVIADARSSAKIETFNLDGTPQKATDAAEPPPVPAPAR